MSKKHHHDHHAQDAHHDNHPDEAVNESLEQEALEDEALVEEINQEYDTLFAQIDKLKEQVLRERAENENLRKRQERELQNAYKFASEKLIRDLLPVVDSLTLGLEAAKQNTQNPEAISHFIDGSEMTLKLLNETLQKNGVVAIDPMGEKFNPELHEAVSMIANPDVEPNTIIHVAQKGYSLNGRVVRAAQVVVAKGN